MVDIAPSQQFTLNTFQRNSSLLTRLAEQLASGFRVNRAADDAAALAIGTRLATEASSFDAVSTSINLGQSTLRVADGALSQQQELLVRANTLAVQAGSSFLSDQDRANLNTEFQAIVGELDRIGADTEIFGQNVLAGPGNTDASVRTGTGIIPSQDTVDIQIGESTATSLTGDEIDPATLAPTGGTLTLADLDISTQFGADQANVVLSSAIEQVVVGRVNVGADQAALENAGQVAATNALNFEAARSGILDAQIPGAITAFTNAQNLGRVGIETLNLQNELRGSVLNLFA